MANKLICPNCGGPKTFYAKGCRKCCDYSAFGTPSRITFESRIQKTDSCWLWTGRLTKQGYGQRKIGDKLMPAHRAAWLLLRGSIPDGMCVCHRCDVRNCVNPDHLFIGTNDDNMADMVAKRRQPLGRRNAAAKLTEADVQAIRTARANGQSAMALAKAYGLYFSTVYKIVRRETWRHVA